MAKEISIIRQEAQQVQNATQVGENTAQRVGGVLTDIVDKVEEHETGIDNLNANTGVNDYPAFSENTAYSAGDVVNYQGKLYKFTSDHVAGAWTGTDVEETDVVKAHIVQELGDSENAVMSQASLFRIQSLNIGYNFFLKEEYQTDFLDSEIISNTILVNNGSTTESLQGAQTTIKKETRNPYGCIILSFKKIDTVGMSYSNIVIYNGDNVVISKILKGTGTIIIPYGYSFRVCSKNLKNKIKYYDCEYLSDYVEDDIFDLLSPIKNKAEKLVVERTYYGKDFTAGFYPIGNTGIGNILTDSISPNDNYICFTIETFKGDKYYLKTLGGENGRAYCFIDKSRTIIEYADSLDYSNGIEIVSPTDGYLICHNNINQNSIDNVILQYIPYNERLTTIEILKDKISEDLSNVYENLYEEPEFSPENLTVNTFYPLGNTGIGNVLIDTPYTNSSYSSISVKCFKGDLFELKTFGGANGRSYGFIDNDRKILSMSEENANFLNGVFLYAENDGYLICNTNNSYSDRFYLKKHCVAKRYQLNTDKDEDTVKTLKVLAIGNSFSDDMLGYVNELFVGAGYERDCGLLEVYICANSGYSLEEWVDRYNSEILTNIQWRAGLREDDFSWGNTDFTFKQILSRDWDIVVLTQASDIYTDYSTYKPYFTKLVSAIKECNTNSNVKIGWQVAWSRMSNWSGSSAPVGLSGWNEICDATKTFLDEFSRTIDFVVNTGTALQALRGSSLNNEYDLTRDGHHLCFGVGRYLSSCCFFEAVISKYLGIKLYGNTTNHSVTTDETSLYPGIDVTDDNRLTIQHYAIMSQNDLYNI